ncbi:unnamed protein product [Alopecurus aequalis]
MDKWKLSKKGRSRSDRNYNYSDAGAASTSTTATRDGGGGSSRKQQEQETRRLSKKFVKAAKEHRARFYIVRRCVSMLVCWRDN